MSKPQLTTSPQIPTGMPDILQMAQKIAQNMPAPEEGKQMDMGHMVKHVSESVMTMMGNPDMDLSGVTNTLVQTFENMQQQGEVPLPPIPNSKIKLPTNMNIGNKRLKDPKEIREQENYFEELDDDEEADDFCPRTKDLHFNLNVNLEDFYNGKVKKLAIKRKRIKKNTNGKTIVVEEKKKIAIKIEPGMRDEQVIRFNKEADELPNYEPGDIVITLCENPHGYFEREGDNLFIVKTLSLYESLAVTCGKEVDVSIKHLDGSIIQLNTDNKALHSDEGLRKIQGEGMPLYRKEGKGDLFVRFNLVIPEKFNESKIDKLKDLFPPLNESNIGSTTNSRICILEDLTDEDFEALDYGYSSDEESESSYTSSDSEEQVRPGYRQTKRGLHGRTPVEKVAGGRRKK
jgi:DnaJ-class molecular chaperone